MAVLDIWNRALSAAHARGRLSSTTESSPEQEVITEWYDHTVRTVQSAAWWPGCKTQARLALISTASDTWTPDSPETGYQYSYALPTNMLRAWHLSDYSRFSLSFNASAARLVLNTNAQDPILTYAIAQPQVTLWTQQQENATVFALAASIVGPLTGKRDLTSRLFQQANLVLEEARAATANDLGGGSQSQVPWFAARGYGSPSPTRFLYPFGELFSYAG